MRPLVTVIVPIYNTAEYLPLHRKYSESDLYQYRNPSSR